MAACALAFFPLASASTSNTAARTRTGTRTFESDAVGAMLRGCITPAGTAAAAVSGMRGFQSARSLRLHAAAAGPVAAMECPVAIQRGADFHFDIYPATLVHGFQFALLGHLQGIAGSPRPVFHFGVLPNGSLKWNDVRGWIQVAPAGTLALGRWSTIRVQVRDDQQKALVYIDGRYVGEGGPVGVRRVQDVSGYRLSTLGTAPARYGKAVAALAQAATALGQSVAEDDVFFDNVSVGSAIDALPAVSFGPFLLGSKVTVAKSATTIQMPNTAVNVTVAGRTQTLMSYPAHSDGYDGTGNMLVVSKDGGRSWSSANARNPMPTAPSYSLTRLSNGDLIALDYHTYLIPGSGDRQAELPTAISHDGGYTWIRRDGVLTTPQPMRSLASVSDRIGSTLGGFFLAHPPLENADGTLLQSAYGKYDGDTRYRQIVLQSTDTGLHWTVLATVAAIPKLSTGKSDARARAEATIAAMPAADMESLDSVEVFLPNPEVATGGFQEGAMARVADGSLLIVMRTGSYLPMYTARSTDDGRTWSSPQRLVAGPDNQPVVGIYPSLVWMANGTLVLLVGRPGMSLLASLDGNGHHWTKPQVVDYPNDGNGTMVAIDANHVLVFGDRGANWSIPRPAIYQVWSRRVTVPGGKSSARGSDTSMSGRNEVSSTRER